MSRVGNRKVGGHFVKIQLISAANIYYLLLNRNNKKDAEVQWMVKNGRPKLKVPFKEDNGVGEGRRGDLWIFENRLDMSVIDIVNVRNSIMKIDSEYGD